MGTLSLLALAAALAMDTFAVALAAGASLRPLTFRPCFRLVFHFSLFQGMMPVVGWLAGLTIQSFVATWSHWIAFGLLLFIGGRMIKGAFTAGDDIRLPMDPSRGWNMVALSVATSIDALAVGTTLAMLDVVIWIPSLVIGLVTGGFTAIGLFLGTKVGPSWGQWVEVVGGVILVGIGVKILLSALFFEISMAGTL